MSSKQDQQPSVTVIIAMKDAQTTILYTLASFVKQTYPIKEIFVVDNDSDDRSVAVVKQFMKKHGSLIRLIQRKENKGVGSSFNVGAKYATGKYIIVMHSDCSLPTNRELSKLVEPLRRSDDVVASCPTIILPEYVWNKYNFWEKCLLSRSVGKEYHSLSTKFDAIRKSTFVDIGGFDEINFGEDIGSGSEDADLHIRLKKVGKIAFTEARALHLHYLSSDYSVWDWIKNRKLLARSYGRHIRMHFADLSFGAVLFGVKPLLAILPFLPGFHAIGLLLLAAYSIVYTSKMYVSPSAHRDPRIILLPFINIYLVYYEVFWMAESFLFLPKQ